MIIRDSRDPKGRLLEPRRTNEDVTGGLRPILGPLEDGKTWRDSMRQWIARDARAERSAP